MGSHRRRCQRRDPLEGGSFRVESVAGFAWNQWQLCHGISGRLHVEWVAAFAWNQWQASHGMGGSFAVEYALALRVEKE